MCNEEMEIQKIFSDYYDEERYYSVLMTEEELALFSDEHEKAVGKGLKIGAGVGTAATLGAGAYGAHKIIRGAQKFGEMMGDKSSYKDTAKGVSKFLNNSLKEVHENKIVRHPKAKLAALGAGVLALGTAAGAGVGGGIGHLVGKKRRKKNEQ